MAAWMGPIRRHLKEARLPGFRGSSASSDCEGGLIKYLPLLSGHATISFSERASALSRKSRSFVKSKALSNPPTIRIVVSKKETVTFAFKVSPLATQFFALQVKSRKRLISSKQTGSLQQGHRLLDWLPVAFLPTTSLLLKPETAWQV